VATPPVFARNTGQARKTSQTVSEGLSIGWWWGCSASCSACASSSSIAEARRLTVAVAVGSNEGAVGPAASRKDASGRAPSSGGSKTVAVLALLASDLERYELRHLMPMVVRPGSLLHRRAEFVALPGARARRPLLGKAALRKRPLPGKAVSPCKTNWPRAPECLDADKARVLRCGSGAQGRRLRLTPQPGPSPGES
jgi:hypothetical protein